jgi:hypothetical protein
MSVAASHAGYGEHGSYDSFGIHGTPLFSCLLIAAHHKNIFQPTALISMQLVPT